MSYYVEVPVEAGDPVLVEVTGQVEGVVPAGRTTEVIGRMTETFEQAFDRFRKLATASAARATDVDRVTIEFGVKATVKGGFVVAETSGEAHVKVTFEWRRGQETS